tara:strand:+ start:2451 stop:2672 length:222 start_codon:yes stop_codon:yes gene_type:complete
MNKLGAYVQKLMTIVIDGEQDEFIRRMAFDELKKLKGNIEEFIIANDLDFDEVKVKETEKILLQEKENGKNTK